MARRSGGKRRRGRMGRDDGRLGGKERGDTSAATGVAARRVRRRSVGIEELRAGGGHGTLTGGSRSSWSGFYFCRIHEG